MNYCINIAICDDEKYDLEKISRETQDVLSKAGITFNITTYNSGVALLDAIHNGTQFHLLLLDVVMDEMSGMDLAASLRRQHNDTAIIFISSNRDMALRGYEVAAVRYLAKPLDRSRLEEALLFVCHANLKKKEILLPTSKGQRRILISDIIYAEAWERGIKLFLKEEQLESSMKFSDLEKLLPDSQFTLCHRAYLINLSFVQYLRSNELELKSGDTLPISKYRRTTLREKLINYLEC